MHWFKIGDRVAWNSEAGRVRGTIFLRATLWKQLPRDGALELSTTAIAPRIRFGGLIGATCRRSQLCR